MDDINDLLLFAAVVTHGSFSAASRALGIPKSRISRRVAGLEQRIGVRLLQRSTRAVHVTEVGTAFYEHCEAVRNSARDAFEIAERAGDKPSGVLRVSCPVGVAHIFVAPILARFILAHPNVRLELNLTNHPVDVIAEGYDLALRIRTRLEDSDLVVRKFALSEQVLVASPIFVAQHGPFDTPSSLQRVVGCGPAGVRGERNFWRLSGPDGGTADIEYRPALATDDVHVLAQAVMGGVGVAQLPLALCAPAVADGRLEVLLPRHRLPQHQLHAVFPSRRGLAPAVRAFLDFLGTELGRR